MGNTTGSTAIWSRPSSLTALALSAALLGSPVLSGCASEEEQDVYCATADGTIVNEDECERDQDGSGGHFIWIGSFGGGHQPGYRLPASSSSQRFRYNDSASRSKYGLPSSGKVTGGSGGFGGKTTGVSKGGGFGGHGSSGGHGGS